MKAVSAVQAIKSKRQYFQLCLDRMYTLVLSTRFLCARSGVQFYLQKSGTQKKICPPLDVSDLTKNTVDPLRQELKQALKSFCYHCVESVQIRNYFWFEYRKIRTRNNSVFGHFSRSVFLWHKFCFNTYQVFNHMKTITFR